MKRFVRMLAAMLIVTLCMSSFAIALAEKVKATGNCNVRTGPGLEYSSRGTLHKGEKATYLDVRKKDDRGVSWLKIKFNGKTGWVSTKYATLTKGSTENRKVRITGSVYVRTSPKKTASKLGTAHSGQELKYRNKMSTDSRGIAWYAVVFNGDYGWVSSKYSYLK